MRTIQEIFDVIIEKGLYPYSETVKYSTNYMCIAAQSALHEEHISSDECSLIKKTIKDYINNINFTLIEHLESLGIPQEKDHCLEIYQNWALRPVS